MDPGNSLILINTVAASIALLTGFAAWARGLRRDRYLAALMLALLIWTGGEVMIYISPDFSTKILWQKIEYVGNLLMPVLFFLLALSIADSPLLKFFNKPKNQALLYIIPILTLLLTFTNEYHHLIWTSVTPDPSDATVLKTSHAILYWVSVLGYSFSLALTGIFVLFHRALTRQIDWYFSTPRLVLAGFMPMVATVMYATGRQPIIGLELISVSFVLTGVLLNIELRESTLRQLREKERLNEQMIAQLNTEIQTRQQIEANLAENLSAQTQKLAGLYDLILLGGSDMPLDDLMPPLMEKVISVSGAASATFLLIQADRLHLHGGTDFNQNLAGLPVEWARDFQGERVVTDIDRVQDLPVAFHATGFKSCFCRRITLADDIAGSLVIFWQQPRNFTVEEITLLTALGDEIRVIVDNARLRTRIVSQAVIQERRRLARDLHDSVTQSLYSLQVTAETAAIQLERDRDALPGTLKRLETNSRQALREMRLLLYELRLQSPFEINVASLIRNRLEAVERKAGIEIGFTSDNEFAAPKEIQMELYPIAMEALNNSLKYARARKVSVAFRKNLSSLEMTVEDDGIGFDLSDAHDKGLGLKTMAERSAKIGAALEIKTKIGKGTSIKVSVPFDNIDGSKN